MIDLHLHTKYSDGTSSVEELLKNAESNKLEIISITDHDTIDAYYEIENNPGLLKNYSGKIIVGAELKAIYNKENVEILAYGIDYKKLKIVIDKEKIQNIILQHFFEVGEKLGFKFSRDIRVDITDSTKQFASNVFSDEILKYQENKKIIGNNFKSYNRNNFFREHESKIGSPFYFDASQYYKSINEVVQDIHNAGGLAFLAHSFKYPFKNKEKTIEDIFINTNIDGAECEYSSFTKEETSFMKNLCKKYNKYMSGGSDFHGVNNSKISMGTGINNNLNIDKSIIEPWINLKEIKII